MIKALKEVGGVFVFLALIPWYFFFGWIVLYHHCKEDLKDVD
jgi:hypothetical protein